MTTFALVMAGGRGTRFWPESTSKKPKQYLSLTGDKPLLMKALNRFDGLVTNENRYIVTTLDQEMIARESSKGAIADHGFIFEPAGRNTAPCILLALARLLQNGATLEDQVIVVPSDHVILNENGFRDVLKDALTVSSKESKIVTIGIVPTFPHTGYGYIERGEEIGRGIYTVNTFKEKPAFEVAEGYLKTGRYYWNAGMFVAKIGLFLEEFKKHSPETFAHFDTLKKVIDRPSELKDAYGNIPKDSIDYAVMEKSDRVMVCESRFDWNDLGSWDALESVIEKRSNNVIISSKQEVVIEASNNIIYAPNQVVSLVNVEDLIVVSNNGVLMILKKSEAQRVKELVTALEKSQRTDLI